jgi:basic membrane protein A
MLRKRSALIALLLAFALVAAACSDDSDDTTTTAAATEDTEAAPETTEAAPETTAAAEAAPETTEAAAEGEGVDVEAASVCEITDVGGIDDKSFNQSAFEGAQQAEAEFGWAASFVESQDATDFRPNIDSLIAEGCTLLVTVGFALAADTAQASADNPDQYFAIVDQAPGPFEPWIDPDTEETISPNDWQNLRGLVFATDQAAFLAGYLAAAASETGVVGTFGGINIPPVTVFMDGFVWGVDHYNEVNGTEVVVLGWDPDTAEGLFTNNFESLDDGRAFAQSLVDEGADIILPVAGPVGLGSAAVCQETGACLMVGVDADQFDTAPEFADVWLTSVLKLIGPAVFTTVQNLVDIGAVGNDFLGTLDNGGVGLAPAHDVPWPDGIADELAQIEADIIAGTIAVPPEAEDE